MKLAFMRFKKQKARTMPGLAVILDVLSRAT
jgi:hypothetical protein